MSASVDKTIRLWDADLLQPPLEGHEDSVNSVAFPPLPVTDYTACFQDFLWSSWSQCGFHDSACLRRRIVGGCNEFCHNILRIGQIYSSFQTHFGGEEQPISFHKLNFEESCNLQTEMIRTFLKTGCWAILSQVEIFWSEITAAQPRCPKIFGFQKTKQFTSYSWNVRFDNGLADLFCAVIVSATSHMSLWKSD